MRKDLLTGQVDPIKWCDSEEEARSRVRTLNGLISLDKHATSPLFFAELFVSGNVVNTETSEMDKGEC
jgi:hypothetical protein